MSTKPDTILWHNLWKRPLPTAVAEASAAHVRRLGQRPTHVIFPLGEYPAEIGGLKVETCVTVDKNHLKVYNGEEK